jgi:3-oxoacyl-[acyl-carrier protein] reductase
MGLLEGRVSLVTGASRGIGRAIANALAKEGAHVVLGARDAAKLREAVGEIAAAGGRAEALALDVAERGSVEAGVAHVLAAHGRIDHLVNNAGVTRDNLLLRMKDEEWDDIMSTNLRSVYRLSKRVLRPMVKARYGRIINITSVVGVMGNPGQTNYAAAKAGIVGFSKSLAREVGARNITINCVAPGFIDTDMTRALGAEQRSALIGHIPLGRLGEARDVAAAVAFLASPGASYITGSTIHVNGGMYMD